MKPKIYLETTIGSYLSARQSYDLITAAHQQITREWWETRRREFDLYVSQIVIQESSDGDENAVEQRLEILKAPNKMRIRTMATTVMTGCRLYSHNALCHLLR